jgi:uncharacterized membrane protein
MSLAMASFNSKLVSPMAESIGRLVVSSSVAEHNGDYRSTDGASWANGGIACGLDGVSVVSGIFRMGGGVVGLFGRAELAIAAMSQSSYLSRRVYSSLGNQYSDYIGCTNWFLATSING